MAIDFKPCPAITTKDEFALASKSLMLGLMLLKASGSDNPSENVSARALDIRRALQAAPFTMGRQEEGGFEAVDATPESKAEENARMDEAFGLVGIEIPAAEPVAV